jgi:hypothetical protein
LIDKGFYMQSITRPTVFGPSKILAATFACCIALPIAATGATIDSEVVWNDRTAIHTQDGGGIEVTGTGTLIANARVDIDSPGFLLIRSGGVVQFNDQFKFPDNNEGPPGPTIQIESGGLMEVADTEAIGERLFDGGLFLAPGATFKTGNISTGERRDPRTAEWRIEPWTDMGATGIDISIDGDVATILGVPEPQSLLLLCLGLMTLMCRRR